MLRSELGVAGPAAGPRPSDAAPDIPDCVLSELWAEHSDGVGSPLIDIFTETDCSSQMSDDEPAAPRGEPPAALETFESRLAACGGLELAGVDADMFPIAVGEKLIEVVEDDDFGAVAEGGGLIWVVENDVEGVCSEISESPGRDSGVLLNGAVNSGLEGNSPSSLTGSSVWESCLQRPSAPKRRKPGTKLKHVTKPVPRPRPAKSSRKSLALAIETVPSGNHAVSADAASSSRLSTLPGPGLSVPAHQCGSSGERVCPVDRPCSVGSGAPSAAVDHASPGSSASTESDLLARSTAAGAPGSPGHFSGFPARSWVFARARWLLQLSGIAAEEREHDSVSREDAAILRLQELAAASAVRFPASRAEVFGRSAEPPAGPVSGGDGDVASAVRLPAITAVALDRPPDSAGPTAGGDGDAASCALPTYASLMPDVEKDRFKGGFLSQLSLRHVDDPPPPPRLSRTMRQRLRKRKAAPEDTPEKTAAAESPKPPAARTLLSAARLPGALPPARRMKVLRKPGGALLRRSFVAPAGESPAPGGDSSGDEAAARRERRARSRLLDFGELVEVEGVLDLADTYSGSAEPPRLLPELTEGGGRSPPPRPPELRPQRWPRADSARCRVCRKFIARVLLPLHLRLHRTGYRGCDVCGQVLESAATLYRHRLGHEPPCYPCTRCGRVFDAPVKLERHRVSAHGLLLCARCGAPVSTPEQVQDHGCDGREAPQQHPLTAIAAPTAAAATTTPAGGKQSCSSAGDGLVCDACGKSFLVRFNYTMHMKMVHKRGPGRLVAERPPLCPDSVLGCLGDILSPDLYSEIVSVV